MKTKSSKPLGAQINEREKRNWTGIRLFKTNTQVRQWRNMLLKLSDRKHEPKI